MCDVDLIKAMLETAGELAMSRFRKVTPSLKKNRTYVTEADLAVQHHLVKALGSHAPEDGIIAEEEDLRKPPASGERYWVIDPIDGTNSFVSGLPIWGLAIGLVEDGQARAGFFYMPVLKELYHTVAEREVYRNGQSTHMRDPEALHSESLLLTTTQSHRTCRISPGYPGHVKCLGSAVAHVCYTATGSVDAVFLAGIHVWDIAAGLAMLQNNGGVLRYLGGPEVSLSGLMTGDVIERPMLGGHPEMVDRFERVIHCGSDTQDHNARR